VLKEKFEFTIDLDKSNGHDDASAFVSAGGPIDVDARLETLSDAGTDDAGATTNDVQHHVIPSLLRKGAHPDDVLEYIVDETMARVGDRLSWSRAAEVRDVTLRIISAYKNVLLKDYDPASGAIPDWLPGEFHEAWARVLNKNGRPMLHYNSYGFCIRGAQQHFPHNHSKGKDTEGVGVADEGATPDSRTSKAGHAKKEPPPRSPFVLRPFVPFDLATLPPRQWLYGRHYQRGTVSATIAPGGFGKTTLCMVEAVAMATCCNLLGEQPTERLRAWYHNGEDTLEELNRRLGAICLHYKIPQEELRDWFFMTSGNEVPLRVASGYSDLKIDEPLIKCITAEVKRNEIDVAVLDPLVTLHAVPEQDNGKMDQVVRIFAAIADGQECAVELAHHTRKLPPGANGTDYVAADIRGATATRDAVRAARMLNQMTERDAETAGIPEHERAAYFRVDRVKGNNSPAAKAVWRRFVNVDLPNTDEVGVVVPWEFPGQGAPSEQMAAAEQAAESLFMDQLARFTLQGRTVGDRAGSNHAPLLFSREAEAKAAKIGKEPLAAAMRRLFAKNRIRVEASGKGGRRIHCIVIA
jgi:AAA domain